jgi:hypothetical protein
MSTPQRKRVHVVHDKAVGTPVRSQHGAAVIVTVKEKELLEEIADLAEMVVEGRGYGGGYQKGLPPKKLLEQKLIDLRIIQNR